MCETVLTTVADLWPKITRKYEFLYKTVYFTALLIVSLPFVARVSLRLRSSWIGSSSSYRITPVPYPVLRSFIAFLQVNISTCGSIAFAEEVFHSLIWVSTLTYACCCQPPSVYVSSGFANFCSGSIQCHPIFPGQVCSAW